MKHVKRLVLGLAAGLTILFPLSRALHAEEGNQYPWNMSVTAGWLDYEGDEAVDDSFTLNAHLGYDWTDWWTFEGIFILAPDLKGQHYYDYSTGTKVDVNRLEEETGVSSTWGAGIAVDAMFHFTRWKRLDPYLSLGGGFMKYADDINGDNGVDAVIRAGGGVLYHFNDEWAIRADYHNFVAGSTKQSDGNTLIEAGVNWTWGAHVPANYKVAGGPKDTDADGLTDAEEAVLGTDPYSPDTDKDKLSDYDEVKVHRTDPLNPDTDYDGLQDGAEVNIHHTDPLQRDTDKGGVADGHEVIEDGTNPLNPADDLVLYTLNIEFDYDKAIIKPQYFMELDVIAKVLTRDPGAIARIEGHADKLKKSLPDHNMKLSQARADAVKTYLVTKHAIDGGRLTPVGYGFNRPKAPNDPVYGNPVNRRVEVYIRKSDNPANTTPATKPEVEKPSPAI